MSDPVGPDANADVSALARAEETEPALAAASTALARGQIVCFPTESSYGLAVRIDRPAALARLVAMKGRPADSPFALVAADLSQARTLTDSWPPRAEALARAHWPGPLTLVVPARADLPPELIGPGLGVGVRVPGTDLARALPRLARVPVTATSANPSGQSPALSVAQARSYFGDAVDVYLDGGVARDARPSTVVSVDIEGRQRVLRVGAIMIQEILT